MKHLISEVENQLNKKIKRVRYDRGDKYILLNNFIKKKVLFMKLLLHTHPN